jgi:two-component system, NarL family, sensor histidine kinase DesK
MNPPITPVHGTVYREQSRRAGVPGLGMRLFLLIYVLFVFLDPLLGSGTAAKWTLAVVSLGVFLPLYAAVWVAIDRRQDRRALLFTVGMAILGLALMPSNRGANTYVIYSAALVPFLLPPRWAIAYLVVLIVHVFALQFAVSGVHMIGITTMLIVMVGGLNLFYAEQKKRDALLWRAKEDVEEMAALAERERISRDLHDILGHTLSVIALKSELASRLADSDPARAADEIRDVERVSRDALSEVRSAVEGYRSSGLQGELRNAARVLESAGVRLDVTIAAAPSPIPPRQESVMALALREAVTNIARHAQARHCWISLLEREGARVLTVRDDGVGGVAKEGNGLIGMRERVAAEGGSVTIDGTHGTTITVSLPVIRVA